MLFGWMKSLIIYLILAGLVVNIAPSGNYVKYIRFFVGLIIVIILIEPISYIFTFDEGNIDSLVENIDEFMSDNSSLKNSDTMFNYYEMSYSKAIEDILSKKGYSIYDVDVLTNDDGLIVKCIIVLTGDAYDEADIKKSISDVYNLEIDSIYIVRR